MSEDTDLAKIAYLESYFALDIFNLRENKFTFENEKSICVLHGMLVIVKNLPNYEEFSQLKQLALSVEKIRYAKYSLDKAEELLKQRPIKEKCFVVKVNAIRKFFGKEPHFHYCKSVENANDRLHAKKLVAQKEQTMKMIQDEVDNWSHLKPEDYCLD